jgi:hypothetical protein
VDLRASSSSDAFATLNKILSRECPFTQWRRIDWTKLYNKYSTRIADAERRNHVNAFRQVLCEYTYSFPDGMCRFTAVLTTSATNRSAQDSVIPLRHSMTVELGPTWSWMTAPRRRREYNPAQRSWLWTASQSSTRRLQYPFSGRENPCLPQPSAALNNAQTDSSNKCLHTFFESALEPGQALAQMAIVASASRITRTCSSVTHWPRQRSERRREVGNGAVRPLGPQNKESILAARILMVFSASLKLGVLHLVYTFWGPSLTPRNPALQISMSQSSPIITKETTMWRCCVGF